MQKSEINRKWTTDEITANKDVKSHEQHYARKKTGQEPLPYN